MVALHALHDEFVGGARQHWVLSCEVLAAKKVLSPESITTIAQIYAFGQFIGNTDMHFGNLSFFVDDVVTPRVHVAPVYDMLPMMWRPGIYSGELDVTPVRGQPRIAGHARAIAQARAWAIQFWREAAQLTVLDNAMREASAASQARLRQA